MVSRKVYSGKQRAERRSKKVGSGLEFADHRDYSPGDDFRYLDWQVFARMERMLIRLHEEEEDLQIYILLDCSRSMSLSLGEISKFDQAAKIAAALAYVGLANLDRVAIVPFGEKLEQRLPPTRGKNQIFKVFRFLESITPGGPTRLNASLKQFVHQNKRRGMAVILSDFYDPEGYDDALSYLRYNGYEPFAIHLVDELEMTPSLRGDLSVVDCETGEVKEITVTPRMLARYKEVHQEFCRNLEACCKQRQASYFRTAIQVPWDEIVLRIFRAGGFLK
ncbi:MAG: DUF58 domain-containing protein [Myxococcales bacterium]|nr:DUF58 domain-containing protein [Myxococcales bacterium]